MSPPLPIYLDNHATTRVDPRVAEAIWPYFIDKYGNAGSVSHAFGWDAKAAVDQARETIGSAVGAHGWEIVFTSGATESNNLVIRGVAERNRRKGNHLISVATEHRAVLDPLQMFARRDYDVTLLDVTPAGDDRAGWLDPQRVADALRDDTILVSVMLANNEIGVLQSLREIADICHARGVPLHTDATQAVGKIPVDVEALGVDLMSFSAHKLYGPKGVGALFIRRRGSPVLLQPQIYGGGQEEGLRSGTLNVPGIVGFAKALELCVAEMPQESVRLAKLRDRLAEGLLDAIDGVTINGPSLAISNNAGPGLRLPNNLNVSFEGVEGNDLRRALTTLAVSCGSACTSENPEPSHVLRALGISEKLARASLRFGLGRFNTAEEIEYAITTLAQTVHRLRNVGTLV